MQVPDQYFDQYKSMGLTDFNATAYGMVENVDENIGRLLKTLEAAGLKENTLIIFTTDNGPNGWRYNGGMKGKKGWVDKGGIRVPLFMRYPKGGLNSGSTIKEIAAHIDLLPTLADLCGLSIPKDLTLDGKSLVPLLNGEKEPWPEREIFTFPIGNHLSPYPGSVRNNTYRMVLERDSTASLFNMLEDPGQSQNIASEQKNIVEDLRQKYFQLFEEVTQLGTEPLPIPLGYAESPNVRFPAPEAKLTGNLNFSYPPGWSNDWVTNWTSQSDQMTWDVEVVAAGDYELSVQYACPETAIGSSFSLNFGENEIAWIIKEAHNPPYLTSPDRVERWEVYEKEWKTIKIGNIALQPGVQKLIVKAQELANAKDVEVKAIWVEKI